MHHYFIECVYAKEDQSERVEDAEEEIGPGDAMVEKAKSQPRKDEEDENTGKHILPPVEKAPVVEEPRKKAKVNDRIAIK